MGRPSDVVSTVLCRHLHEKELKNFQHPTWDQELRLSFSSPCDTDASSDSYHESECLTDFSIAMEHYDAGNLQKEVSPSQWGTRQHNQASAEYAGVILE